MEFELLRVAFAIAGCAALSYFDIFNRRNVPDRLLQAFLAVSLLLCAVSFSIETIAYSLAVALIAGTAGYFAYKMGQVGGADVYAIVSLSLLLPQKPELFRQGASFLSLPPIITTLFYSILIFCIYIMLSKFPAVFRALKKGDIAIPPIRMLEGGALAILYAVFLFSASQFLSLAYLLSFSIISIFAVFFLLFGQFLKKSFISFLPAKKIEEEDVLALEFMEKEIVKKYSLPSLVGSRELSRLKKLPLKKFAVYSKMPFFLPFLLLGFLISLFFGELFLLPFAW